MSEIDYDKLRLDVLQKLIDERNISCKNKKEEMITYLKMDDEGKYIKETIYERNGSGYIVGIDVKNHEHLIQIGKLIEKKEGKFLNRFESDRIIFYSSQKLI